MLNTCQTKTGRVGNKQFTKLGACARRVGNIIHELGHVIGFYHEQNRPDRDKYIKVFDDHIEPKFKDNFDKFPKSETRTIGYAYDYESIMHYGTLAFSNGEGPSFKIRKIGTDFKSIVGQRSKISDLDVAQARDMYSCNKLPVNSDCVKNNGTEYRGTLDYTVSGVTCQRWSANWPHRHTFYTESNIENKGLGDHNFCRNPNNRARPWCFTTKKRRRWQYCDLVPCQS
ncbi:zinc metalloproteinase nas-4-like [Antedon mediterranea]|uniref:zinc metalloproteinase nas-4-like n=1 Tax=Antedon mediterranea TaxID=105859 RepID=UPI003AF6463A